MTGLIAGWLRQPETALNGQETYTMAEYVNPRVREHLFECLTSFRWIVSDEPRDYAEMWPIAQHLITSDDLSGWIVAVTVRGILDRFCIPGIAELSSLGVCEECFQRDTTKSVVRQWGIAYWPIWGCPPHIDQRTLAEMVLSVIRAEVAENLWRTVAIIESNRISPLYCNPAEILNLVEYGTIGDGSSTFNAETA